MGASFRDPSGFLVVDGEHVLRTVRPEFTADTITFLGSQVARDWVRSGRLIATEMIEKVPGGPLHLAHPRIFFPSYPWEWTPGQLSAAAELTLNYCESLIDAGWILKDASPLNVLFDGPQPVFVDLLSVERREPDSALWSAYAQFVRTFLLPLAAFKYLGWPLSASISRRDGYEPTDLYSPLSVMNRIRAPLRSLVTLPVLLERWGRTPQSPVVRRSAPVAAAILKHTLHSLRGALRRLTPVLEDSRWSTYPEQCDHYSQKDSIYKATFVRECVSWSRARDILAIGANTGTYSGLAASCGTRLVALDKDITATERAWRKARRDEADILPLVADITRPTPAVGWNNAESLSLLERCRGRFDLVMMLAVLHHLLISDQIPIEQIAKLAHELTRRWLLVEWVPASDPKFRELSRGRDPLYRHLDAGRFFSAFDPYFQPVRHIELENGRTIHLMEAR
jgi:hypothetical protein